MKMNILKMSKININAILSDCANIYYRFNFTLFDFLFLVESRLSHEQLPNSYPHGG